MNTTQAPLVSAVLSNKGLRRIKDLPGPYAWPLVGNIFQLKKDRIHQDVEKLCQRFGSLLRVHIGRLPVLVIANHEVVKAALRERPSLFRRPSVTTKISAELGGLPNVFNAEGEDWRNQRRFVMASFAPKSTRAYFPYLVKVALRLQKRWRTAIELDQSIDLSADLKRYTVDIIAGLAFGQEVNTLEAGDNVIQQHLDCILPGIARRSLSVFPYWRYFKLPQDHKLEHSNSALRTAVFELITKARARMASDSSLSDKPNNLLEAMLAAAGKAGSNVDDDTVAGNVQVMLLAGEDTTANTIAWLLHLLHRNPEALKRAINEIRQIAPDCANFSLEQIDALVYLDATVQETMRLKPVGPFLPLEAALDVQVEGVYIPKGGLLWCVMRHDSVNEQHFSEPKRFRPERWLDDCINKQVSLPFGSGPRSCPGRYLALLEIKIAVAMLLSTFELLGVNAPDGNEARELMGFVMSPVDLSMQLKTKNLTHLDL